MFTSSVERFIEHERQEKTKNADDLDMDTVEGQIEALKRKFSTMTDPVEYEKLLNTNERRISHKAMLSALMISLYHQQPCFQQAYQMLHLLMDIDSQMTDWRRMCLNISYL